MKLKYSILAYAITIFIVVVMCSNVYAADPLIQTFSNLDFSGSTSQVYYFYNFRGASGDTTSKIYAISSLVFNITKIKDNGTSWLIDMNTSGWLEATSDFYSSSFSTDFFISINGYDSAFFVHQYTNKGEYVEQDYNNPFIEINVPKKGMKLNMEVKISVNSYDFVGGSGTYSADTNFDKTMTLNLNNPPLLSISSPTSAVYLNGKAGHDTLTVSGKVYDPEGNSVTLGANINNGTKTLTYASAPTTKPNSDNFQFIWDVNKENFADGTYVLTLTATDLAGDSTVISQPFTVTVDRIQPNVYPFIYKVKGGSNFNVTSTETGYVYIVSTGTYNTQADLDAQVSNTTGTKCSIASPGVLTSIAAPTADGMYYAYAIDYSGNISLPSSPIQIDSTAPRLISAKIVGNSIVLTYDESFSQPDVPAADDFLAAKESSINTIYAIASEDAVSCTTTYSDLELDPQDITNWKYVQDHNYFENSNGVASYSGQWLNSPISTFDKVGKYTVTCKMRDIPSNDSRFSSYKQWSNESPNFIIYVHRRPIADFSAAMFKSGSSYTTVINDTSYDIDHQSQQNKGIIGEKWRWEDLTSGIWANGPLPASLAGNKKYIAELQVQDAEGAWSTPAQKTIDTTITDLPPYVDCTPQNYDGMGPVSVTVTGDDKGENDFAKINYAWSQSTSKPSSWSTSNTKVFTTPKSQDGTWYLHMEIFDRGGQSYYVYRGPYKIDSIKAYSFKVSMIQDSNWRNYYFELNDGIDANGDGIADMYPRRSNTDIYTTQMPVNAYGLVSYGATGVRAGAKIRGSIIVNGSPDSVSFTVTYFEGGTAQSEILAPVSAGGGLYTFDWIAPMQTDRDTHIAFNLNVQKGTKTYGNEIWKDTWAYGNSNNFVIYINGGTVEDDILFQQSN